MTAVELAISELNPELFCCTESRITNDIQESELSILDYKTVRSDSISRFSGGVTVFINCTVNYKIVSSFVNGYNNIIVLDILNGKSRGRWFMLYHSPNSSHAQFIDNLTEIVEKYSTTTLPLRIIGDFNINVHRIETISVELTKIDSKFYQMNLI